MTTSCRAEEALRTLLLTLRDPSPAGNLPPHESPGSGGQEPVPELLLCLGADGSCFDYVPAPGFTRNRDQIIGARIDDLVAPRSATEYLHLVNQVIIGQRPNICYTCIEDQTRCRHFEVRTVPAGKDRAMQVIRDITDERDSLARIRESGRQLSTLLSNLPGMAYRCANDVAWTMEFVSEGCRELTGYESADLVGNARISYADLILPEDRALVYGGVQEALGRAGPFQLEYRICRADGAVRWVWERGAGVHATDGSLLALEGFITDITSRKLAEQDASQRVNQQAVVADLGRLAVLGVPEDELFQATVERVAQTLDIPICGILRHEPGKATVRFGAGVGYAAGVRKGDALPLLGEGPMEWALRDLAPIVVADFARETRFEPPSWIAPAHPASGVIVMLAGDEAPFGVLEAYALQPERFGEREARFVQVVANLLTHALQRSWAEQRRLEMARQLRQAQKAEALGTLAAGVAHDFSNFATAVLGYLDLAVMRLDEGGDVVECLDGIRKATDQARNITRSLLTFSRKLDVDRAPFPLVEAINEAAQLLRHLLPAAVRLSIEVPPGYEPWLVGHSGQLQQVIMNLAINARDAMPQGGRLRVALGPDAAPAPAEHGARPRPGALLVVEDSGCGIPPGDLNRIFDPFFTTKPRERGTGLGLSIVQGIVSDHGGTIAVDSTVGTGTRFSLRFSTCDPKASRAKAVAPEQPTRGAGEVVLVVEDNELVRALIASAVKDTGYQPLQAGDGDEALRLFRAQATPPHLLVLDCDLPKRSGPATLEEIRRTHPAIPAILISGDVTPPRAALGSAQTVFLSKPFSMAKLTSTIALVLARAR